MKNDLYHDDPTLISLKGYYAAVAASTIIGIVVVFLLNVFTPLESVKAFVEVAKENVTRNASTMDILFFVLYRVFLIALVAIAPLLAAMRILLQPIIEYRNALMDHENPSANKRDRACRRLINLPYLFIPINIVLWIIMPSLIFSSFFFQIPQFGLRSVITFSARAAMVGLISSAIAFLMIESFGRERLIPIFFPEGRLTEIKGTAKISISRRIRMVYRFAGVIPMTILIATLVILQWDLGSSQISAMEYGRGILIFTIVLFGVSFVSSGIINRRVSANITDPLNEIIKVLRQVRSGYLNSKVRVVSNDEIGFAGDAINEMTDGLKERDMMRHSLELASEVQQNLLPSEAPKVKGLDIAGQSVYCDRTGGDYYDYLIHKKGEEESFGIVIGDVSEHGIPSALLMTTARALIRQGSSMPGNIPDIVTNLNRELTRDMAESGRFMTLFYLDLNMNDRTIRWVRAGHDPAILYDPETDSFSELKGKGPALGLCEDFQYEENLKEGLKDGQIIFLATDGAWETQNDKGEMFGKSSIEKIIQRNSSLCSREIIRLLLDHLNSFRGQTKIEDDITMVIVKITG